MKKEKVNGLFIPAGALMGLGFGLLFNEAGAGVLIGLGLGFLGMYISTVMKKK